MSDWVILVIEVYLYSKLCRARINRSYFAEITRGYRGTSLRRNTHPPQDHCRALGEAVL